ncbi:helix-turn-helix domain-containing protein [Intestinibacter bartlettii]|uniref:helix-turn-helix domain-containing protein n=1 Tax=Intestinibacter bartlettii TaxID=261299 RepID=UPI001D003CF6|nr:helix-turn-helix transcriptional regulator [Intestinibacter bartlettii]MBS6358631.1 helix-turn-helix transcriptional regulator [Akkermansia muciniphila]MCB5721850.1 helix-turn-helix domain-containing protein [Intestinibacter bartlettii]
MSDIGTQIRNERIRQGLSCRGLARKAGVEYSFLNKVENGYFEPGLEYIIKIGDALNVTFMTKEYMEYMTSDERKLIRHIATKVRDENLIDVDVEAQIMGDYLTYTKLKQEIEKTTEKFLRKMKNE